MQKQYQISHRLAQRAFLQMYQYALLATNHKDSLRPQMVHKKVHRTESETETTTTPKPFENRPGDEMSPEANMRAIIALRNAKEYSIVGENGQTQNMFDKLVIKEPLEFRNLSFSDHLQNIPYNETIFTKKMEEYFYKGLHLTFCRKRDDSLAIKENIERLPNFEEYKNKGSIQCSSRTKMPFFSSSVAVKLTSKLILAITLFLFYTC
ncbi:uncharacterized protein LOC108913774 [Anoplophora glabripennis]|uniref:uncharacterized protein LOC108913774 n=1 Tax=Anoplophora glabripennis TaxID=217634 RepID=UPI00087366F8|nr:uncharacterized protein LOC108913774 [Anoplophora glabripennis]